MPDGGAVMVVIERSSQGIDPVSFEVLTGVQAVAEEARCTISAAMLGEHIKNDAGGLNPWAERVYTMELTHENECGAESTVAALEQLWRRFRFSAVFFAHTLRGCTISARLAQRIGADIVTDCIAVDVEHGTGHLLCRKPVYGGKALATFRMERLPRVVTLRPKVFSALQKPDRRGEVLNFDVELSNAAERILSAEFFEEERIRLDEAAVIVGLGRGVKNPKGIKMAERFVNALRRHFGTADWGVSRPLVDMGMAHSSRQIGLTGEKVVPTLYIAAGISGALQHVTGIVGARTIVAVNSDPDAPIFKYADFGIVGNCEDILPAFTEKLEGML
jgi:electron transfer flavoprotein alpha subunit